MKYTVNRNDYETTGGGRMRTQAEDGLAHVAYFKNNISFVWNGTEGDMVDVCPGGYGESVVARFRLRNVSPFHGQMHVSEFLNKFATECDDFIDIFRQSLREENA